jgi:hypothetical protein
MFIPLLDHQKFSAGALVMSMGERLSGDGAGAGSRGEGC